jgi:predicted nucleic acid-binding protein
MNMANGELLYFLDTSAVAKLYHEEPGSEVVEDLASSPTIQLWIAELTHVEFHSVCLRKVREGQLTEEKLRTVLDCFSDDVRNRFQVIPLDRRMVEQAVTLLLQHGKNQSLRTLDAFQLAAAQAVEGDAITFVTADRKLVAVAKNIFPQVVNPEEQPS